MNRYIVFISYLLFFIWSITNLGVFLDTTTASNDENSIYGYISLICLLLLESLSLFVLLLNIRKKSISKLGGVVIIWLLYVAINTLFNSNDLFKDLREAIWWPLIFILFFLISTNDHDGKYVKLLLKFIKVLIIIELIQYFALRSMTAVYFSSSGKQIFGSSNQIFYIALLLPFAFLFNNKRFKYLVLLVGLFAVLISFKRSAIIYMPLVLLIAIYFDFLKGRKNSFIKSILIATIFLGISFFSYDYIDNLTGGHIASRFENIENDKGSGRLDVFNNVLSAYQKKPLELKLLGSGHNSVIKDEVAWEADRSVPLSAHNDFIEVLYDFGIIGFLIYLLMIFQVLKLLFRVKYIDPKYFHANIAVFVIFVVMSMVSHLIIYPTYFAFLVIIWAITDGQLNELKQKLLTLKRQ